MSKTPFLTAFALAGAVALSACGSSGTSTSAPTSTSAGSSAPAPSASPMVGGKLGFTAAFVCDSVDAAKVRNAVGGEFEAPKPDEPAKGIHACGWVGKDGAEAVVAIVYDDAFDKNFRDDLLKIANDTLQTSYQRSVNTTIDVGARNVTVVGLSESGSSVPVAALSPIANQLNDAIVDADQAPRAAK